MFWNSNHECRVLLLEEIYTFKEKTKQLGTNGIKAKTACPSGCFLSRPTIYSSITFS